MAKPLLPDVPSAKVDPLLRLPRLWRFRFSGRTPVDECKAMAAIP
jgi:hypothetical protein